MKNTQKKIYLAGPFLGLSYQKVCQWREEATALLDDLGVQAIDPSIELAKWSGNSMLDDLLGGDIDHSRSILRADVDDGVMAACGMIVGYPTGTEQTFGTSFELGAAYVMDIPVAVYLPEDEDDRLFVHPFMAAQLGAQYHLARSVADAVTNLAQRLNLQVPATSAPQPL